jgi:hypothetical protein
MRGLSSLKEVFLSKLSRSLRVVKEGIKEEAKNYK